MGLSYEITETLIEQLKLLDNKFASTYALLKSSSQDELDTLHKYARVSTIGASTRIENALLTDSEINWIDTILTQDGKTTAFQENKDSIKNKLSKDRERSIEEVAGCRAMLMQIAEDYSSFDPIRKTDIRSLHHLLLFPYSKAKRYAGQYKTQTNSVVEINRLTGFSKTIFETAAPGPITDAAMHDLLKWYNQEHALSPWPIASACEFVYRFLAIHPFQDGNGRLGRGLFLLSLLNSKSEVISFVTKYIAIDRYIEKHKEEYYYVLNRCSDGKYKQNAKHYKIQYFLKFMIKIISESLDSIELLKNRYQQEQLLSESASAILQCFRDYPEIRLTTASLIEKTNLQRRTVIRSLNALVKAELIQKYGQGAGTRYQVTF